IRSDALTESNQREVAEWRYGTALDQLNHTVSLDPGRVALERELGSPTEFACRRREPFLQALTEPELRADPADQDDLAARLEHAGKLIKRRFGMGHCGHHVLGHHHVERGIRKFELLSIHYKEALDVGEAKFPYPLGSLLQHRS